MTTPISTTSAPVTLRLAVRGFTRAWSGASHAQLPPLPALQKLVRRGSVSESRLAQDGWDAWHLGLLKFVELEADRWHASAPLEWLGQGGELRPGSWLRAEFAHLEMGSHSARLQPLAGLKKEESTALFELLKSHLQFSGVEVLASPMQQQANEFFLHSVSSIEAVCCPDAYSAVELREALPQGRDGPLLRRLLTEAQMLLHEHPVNAKRERQGARGINAIWLTGLGDFDGLKPSALPRIVSDEPYLAGLCRLHGTQAQPVSQAPAAGVLGEGPVVVANSLLESADPVAALHALEVNWFAPLVTALAAGRLAAVELALDHHRVTVDSASLRRFWKRGPSLSRWLQ